MIFLMISACFHYFVLTDDKVTSFPWDEKINPQKPRTVGPQYNTIHLSTNLSYTRFFGPNSFIPKFDLRTFFLSYTRFFWAKFLHPKIHVILRPDCIWGSDCISLVVINQILNRLHYYSQTPYNYTYLHMPYRYTRSFNLYGFIVCIID